jgi:hypothetical protein
MNWTWRMLHIQNQGYWKEIWAPNHQPWVDVVVVLSHKEKPGWWVAAVGVTGDKYDLGPFEFEEAKQRAEILGELNEFPAGFRKVKNGEVIT